MTNPKGWHIEQENIGETIDTHSLGQFRYCQTSIIAKSSCASLVLVFVIEKITLVVGARPKQEPFVLG